MNIKCVFCSSIQIFSENFLIARRMTLEIIRNVHRSPCKVLVFLVRVALNLSFLRQFFSKNTQILNFMKIRPVEAQLIHADVQTDGQT